MDHFAAAPAAGEPAETFRAGESQIGLGQGKMSGDANRGGEDDFRIHGGWVASIAENLPAAIGCLFEPIAA